MRPRELGRVEDAGPALEAVSPSLLEAGPTGMGAQAAGASLGSGNPGDAQELPKEPAPCVCHILATSCPTRPLRSKHGPCTLANSHLECLPAWVLMVQEESLGSLG